MRKSIRSLSLTGLGLLAAGLLVPSLAAARDVEITPLVGYRAGGFDLSTGVVCLQPPCPSFAQSEDDPFLGVAVDFPLRERWQFEVLLNRQGSQLAFQDSLDGPKNGIPAADLDVTHLHAGLVRSWELARFEPYAVFGAGLTRLESDPLLSGRVDADRPSASLGGGVRYDFSKRVALRLESRGYWVDLPGTLGNPNLEPRGGDLFQVETTTGLSFRL